jgi:hypothetical protein
MADTNKVPAPQGAGIFYCLQLAWFAAMVLAARTGYGSELTVEAAYRAIPHQRTTFDATESKLSVAHRTALARLFALTDRGVVLRVRGMTALASATQNDLGDVIEQYRTLIDSLASWTAPPEIKPAQELVVESIRLHRQFFADALNRPDANTARSRDVAGNREVRRASQKLHAAYGRLMSDFPNEAAVNRQAFFDHLCALDFL